MGVVIIALLPIGQTKTITCESVENRALSGIRKTCSIGETTAIDSTGYTFSSTSKSTVEALTFNYNKKVEFLPENVAATFPNLLAFNAEICSIKSISKNNFKDLNKLKSLNLASNQISAIFRGTFDDLASLTRLDLGELISIYD